MKTDAKFICESSEMGWIPYMVVEPYVGFWVKPLPPGLPSFIINNLFHRKRLEKKIVLNRSIKKYYKYFRINDFFKNIFSLSCLPLSREGTTLTADSLALDSPWLSVVVIFALSHLQLTDNRQNKSQFQWIVRERGLAACLVHKSTLSSWHQIGTETTKGLAQICSLFFYFQNNTLHKASTTLSLDLCPPASPQFTGAWNGKTSSPHANHPENTSISHFSSFLSVKWNLSNLNSHTSTLIPLK